MTRSRGSKTSVKRIAPPPPKLSLTTGQRIPERHKSWWLDAVKAGMNPYQAGEKIGISRASSRRLMTDNNVRFRQVHQPKNSRFIDPTITAPRATPKLKKLPRDIAPYEDIKWGELAVKTWDDVPDPVLAMEDLLSPQSEQAWLSFGYYRQRYFQRRNIAWQIEMCQILMAWLEEARQTDERVLGVVNTPPGGGKTTTVTHDFPAWVITRNRNIRAALGSKATFQSERYVRRIRNTFERNLLLNLEFGRFKPLEPEIWRKDQFLIDGVSGHIATNDFRLSLAGFDPEEPNVKRAMADPNNAIHEILANLEEVYVTGEKEPTVSALSYEMSFLGGRYDLNLWDDLVDKSNASSPEQRDRLADLWDNEAVQRCEPGGIVGLIGQRWSKYDLYRRNRDLVFTSEEVQEKFDAVAWSGLSDEEMQQLREDLEKELVDDHGKPFGELATPTGGGVATSRKVYRYVRFPAHDDERCPNPTSIKAADHIDCLLDPKRFKWRDLQRAKAAAPRKFALIYQQLDEADSGNLVQEVWLSGGVDADGVLVPGCYNYDRKLLQIPEGLDERRESVYSLVTVDPSASNFWSIQWWLYDKESDRDYLMDMLRVRLMAGSFLDWNKDKNQFDGLAQKWQLRSVQMGWPISLWIVEGNAAQRYLYQYRWVHDWMRQSNTFILPHQTQMNKIDPEYGVATLGPRYQYGLVDLPFMQTDLRTRATVAEFKQELIDWPDGQTDDMVQGHWFLHVHRYKLPDNLTVGKGIKTIRHPYADSKPEGLLGRTVERDPGPPHRRGDYERITKDIWRPTQP